MNDLEQRIAAMSEEEARTCLLELAVACNESLPQIALACNEGDWKDIDAVLDNYDLRADVPDDEEDDEEDRIAALRDQSFMLLFPTRRGGDLRILRAFRSAGIKTIGEIADKTPGELLSLPEFGNASLRRVRNRLAEFNLGLKGDDTDAEDDRRECLTCTKLIPHDRPPDSEFCSPTCALDCPPPPDEEVVDGQWRGPSNTIERMQWVEAGFPHWHGWLRVKHGKRTPETQ